MKILWFTNIPCGASEKFNLNLVVGGWLASLEEQLVNIEKVELSISFYWGTKMEPFLFRKTTYYPIFRAGSGTKAGRLLNRVIQRNNDANELKGMLKIIEIVKPDVIHVHGTENNFGLIQEYTNIPVVLSIQGIISPYLEKYFSGIPLLTAFVYEGLIPKLLLRSTLFMYRCMRKSAQREHTIFSQSKNIIGRTEWDRRISRVLAPESRYYVGNEILRNSFYKNLWNKKQFNNPLQLVTIMSEGIFKGLETIAKAAQILCIHKNIDFRWIVIGQNESNDLAKIVERWLKISFNTLNISLVGCKAEIELVNILLGSDIYCQVSHIENSPNSVCEAMLLGMPIIATFAGGTDTILENKKEGILIQDGDAYSLAGTIIDMAQNFSKAAEYGLNAHAKSRSRHNKIVITKELLGTYKEILDDRHGK